jgi:hypothetical protein
MFVKVLVCRFLSKQYKLSFDFLVAPKPTLPTNVEMIDEVVTIQNDSFFQRITADFKRYGAYIRDKFWEFVERMQKKFNQIRSTISDHFNF